MNCEQVRELEAAFALDALDEKERAAVAAHLEVCGEHGNAAEQRAVAVLLAGSAASAAPPAGLRDRVLASAAERPGGFTRRPWVWWYGAAAAVVVVIAGVIAATMLISSGGEDGGVYVKEFETGSGVSVRFEADFQETVSRATFRGLESRENYHLWAIRGEDWLSIGTFRSNPEGRWSGDFEFQMQPGDAVCLTVAAESEPSGPFGEPIFIEDL